MSLHILEDLFNHELKDVLHAEKQILRGLPPTVQATDSEILQIEFEDNREQTEGQVARLGQSFEIVNTAEE